MARLTAEKSASKKSLAVCIVSVAANFTLFLIKLRVGLVTGSLSIYTDAINNLLDCVTLLIGAVGFFFLSASRTEKFPFGFGRAEELVSFVMSAVVIVTGCAFAYSSLERMLYPVPVSFTPKYAILLAVTAFVKLLMAFFFAGFRRKYPSPILKNMQLDSTLDFGISLVTVLSFVFSAMTGIMTDGLIGLVISIVIVIGGVKMLLPAVSCLLGKRDESLCRKTEEFLLECDAVAAVREVQCHSYGKQNVLTAKVVLNKTDGTVEPILTKIAEDFSERFSSQLLIMPVG